MATFTGQSYALNSDPSIPETIHQAWRETCTAPAALSADAPRLTTIWPRLMPIREPKDTPSQPVSQSLRTASSTASACKILVVEDESIVALDLSNTLRRLGYVVTGVVASGEQAIRQAVETQPDLVMMDIRLQGTMDGVEAARQIRTQLSVPVIFLTAFVDENTLKRAQMTQPAGFLRKPFVKFELQEAIEAALNRPVND